MENWERFVFLRIELEELLVESHAERRVGLPAGMGLAESAGFPSTKEIRKDTRTGKYLWFLCFA